MAKKNPTTIQELKRRLLAWSQAHPFEVAVWGSAGLLALAAVLLFLLRAFPQNLTGEAFYDFQYPYRYPFGEAWRVFFLERIRSRLVHGIFISGLYQLSGYNPPLIYLAIFCLLILTAVAIVYCLRHFLRSPLWAATLVVVFSWLPLGIIDLMSLKKAHHVFAWFAFWLAVLLFQRWVASGRWRHLAGCTLAFMAAVLAYEAPIALLPVAVFLSMPFINHGRDFAKKALVGMWITLVVAFAFLNLEGVKPYSGIESTYSGVFDPGHVLANVATLAPRLPMAVWNGALFGNPGAGATELAVQRAVLVTGAVVAVIAIWLTVKAKQPLLGKVSGWPLWLAAVWLAAFTYLPFLMAGQAPEEDSLRGAAIGLVLVFLAFPLAAPPGLGSTFSKAVLAAVCLTMIASGALLYSAKLQDNLKETARIKEFVLSMRVLAPNVAQGTNFIFVNSGLGRTGCIGLVNMLYAQANLHCIHLLDGDTQETYARTSAGLVENGARVWPENFVILTLDEDGTAHIIEQIEMGQYPLLPVIWESSAPLVTKRELILFQPPLRNIEFYEYTLGS